MIEVFCHLVQSYSQHLYRCWANLSNAASSVVIVPLALLFALAAGFILAAIFAASQDTVLADLRNRY